MESWTPPEGGGEGSRSLRPKFRPREDYTPLGCAEKGALPISMSAIMGSLLPRTQLMLHISENELLNLRR